MNRELIQQAIDALMECDRDGDYPLIEQLNAALAAPVAPAGDKPATSEPVAWLMPGTDSIITNEARAYRGWLASTYTTPLYTAPPDVQRDAPAISNDDAEAIREFLDTGRDLEHSIARDWHLGARIMRVLEAIAAKEPT